MSTLNLAQLSTVGSLTWEHLYALEKTGLTTGITSADSIIISDTSLTSLDGINVYKLKVFDVNNNGDIAKVDSGLRQVTDRLSLSYNAEKVDVVFDQLTSANDVYLQSINSLSADNLTTVNGSLTLRDNNVEKAEFKSLTSVSDSLTIDGNEDLTEVDFPVLTKIGGALNIADNDDLNSLDGFPELETIGGSLNITGTFDNVSFDSLEKVSGAFHFTSDGEVSCKKFKDVSVQGKSKCSASSSSSSDSASSSSTKNSSDSSDSSSSSDSTSSSSSSSSSSSKKSDASTNSLRSAVQLFTVVAGFFAIGVIVF